jgi:hypothetical protein
MRSLASICQQAAEKMIKALLAELGVGFQKIHDIEALMAALRRASVPLPVEFDDLGVFTPFAAFLRYDEFDTLPLDRQQARATIRELRAWIGARIAR